MKQKTSPDIRTVQLIRYVQPFREGGSLPALMDADDGFSYVIKFRGAGQGKKALIAELLGGEIAKIIGLRVPEIVFAELDESFGRLEPDEEIQDLLKFSVGSNLGVSYLKGAITFDPNVNTIDQEQASKIVWLDGLLMNVDRTVRNTNMLIWNKDLWLIDHGASLYFHHNWPAWQEQMEKPFVQIKDHVLLEQATQVREMDSEIKKLLSPAIISELVDLIPHEWLDHPESSGVEESKTVYKKFLSWRLENSNVFINQINHARESRI